MWALGLVLYELFAREPFFKDKPDIAVRLASTKSFACKYLGAKPESQTFVIDSFYKLTTDLNLELDMAVQLLSAKFFAYKSYL